MSHEQSETIERDGKYINVYGAKTPKAGQQLPGTPVYDTLDSAVSAAKQRSEDYGRAHSHMDNSLDSYARARQRANELAPVEEVVGPQVADEIGTMREQEAAVNAATGRPSRSVWDYVTAPVQVGLGLMHDFSSRFRGMLAKQKFEPASGSDLTGLQDEVITPEMQKEILHGAWYNQAFPALMMPKRVVNMFAEIATDPFMLLGGGAGAVSKASKMSKAGTAEGVTSAGTKPGATGQAGTAPSSASPPAQVKVQFPTMKPEAAKPDFPVFHGSDAAGTEALASGKAVGTKPLNFTRDRAKAEAEAKAGGGQVFETTRSQMEKSLGPEGAQAVKTLDETGETFVPAFGPTSSAMAMKRAEPRLFKDKVTEAQLQEADKLKLPIETGPAAKLEPGEENAQAFLEGFGSGRQMRIDEAGAVQKPGQLGLPGIARPKVETERFGQTNTEKGFGFKQRKDGVWEVVAKGDTRFQKLEGKQLTLALQESINLTDKLNRMRKTVEEATLNDEQRRSVAQHLLDSHVATAWGLAKAAPKTGVPEEARIVAENAINRAVVEDVTKAANAWKADPTNEQLKEKLITEMAFFFDVNKKMLSSKAERGAALRAEKTSQDPAVTSIQQFFMSMADGTSLERAVYALDQMKTVQEKANLLKGITGTGAVKGTILQHMLNGLISGTGTPIWNFAAGTSLFGAKVFERWRMEGFKDAGLAKGGAGVMAWAFAKSYIDLIVAGSKLGKNLTESQAGAVSRLKEGIDSAKEVFKDTTGGEFGKLNMRRAISARNYGKEDSWYGPAIDYYGHFINIPSFVVGASDAFLKFAVRQAAMEARAFDEASADVVAQMKMGKQINKSDAGKLVDARRQELMKRPEDTMLPHPETGEMTSLSDTGNEMADLMSMMSSLKSGTLGQSLDKATHNSVLARAIVPFFRVQYLSGREALVRTPILARMAPSVKADLEAGGYRAAKANAQMSTGYALATVGASLTALGFMEGDGPTDPEAAAMWRLSHTPGTIGFPGTKEARIPYTRLGPVGQVLRFMANGTEYLSRLPDSEMSPELVNGVAATLASLVADPSFNRDMNDLFAALATRDKGGLDRWIEHKATMVMPYSALLRQVNKQIAGESQAFDGIFEKMKSVLPGYNGVTYYNELGQKDVVPMDTAWDGMLNNAGFSNKTNLDEKTKKVLDSLDADHVTFSGPDRVHNGVKMTMPEFMELRKTYGETKLGGRTLIEGIEKLVESPMYKRGIPGPDRSRQTMLSALVRGYHAKAFAEFMNAKNEQGGYKHEDFRNQYFQAKKNQFELEKFAPSGEAE